MNAPCALVDVQELLATELDDELLEDELLDELLLDEVPGTTLTVSESSPPQPLKMSAAGKTKAAAELLKNLRITNSFFLPVACGSLRAMSSIRGFFSPACVCDISDYAFSDRTLFHLPAGISW